MTQNAGGAAAHLAVIPRTPLESAYINAKTRAGRASARLADLCNSDAPPPEIRKAADESREASSLLAGYAHQMSQQ